MIDKNVFTQELNKVFTILQELRVVEKYIKELIDSNNLTEDKAVEFEEKLNQYKRDLDYINENTEQLQESLNQININLGDVIEYIDSIKDFIDQNENIIEIGGDLEVGGALRVSSNISAENMNISGELSLSSANNLIFGDGSINVQDLIEYVNTIKDFIDQNENTIEIGGNLEVGGALRVSSNISADNIDISGELSLPSTSNLIFEDGSTFGGGGSGLYLHELTIDISQASNGGTYGFITLNIITNKETEMTTNDIWNYLRNNGFTSLNTSKQCTGAIKNNKNLFSLSISSIYDENDYNYVQLGGLRTNRSKITINETEYTLTTDCYSSSINVFRSDCTIKKQLITKL